MVFCWNIYHWIVEYEYSFPESFKDLSLKIIDFIKKSSLGIILKITNKCFMSINYAMIIYCNMYHWIANLMGKFKGFFLLKFHQWGFARLCEISRDFKKMKQIDTLLYLLQSIVLNFGFKAFLPIHKMQSDMIIIYFYNILTIIPQKWEIVPQWPFCTQKTL